MKKLIPLLAFFFLGTSLVSVASHDLGGEIAYLQTGTDSYQVTYKHYRDCTGAPIPATMDLELKAPGCNSGRTVVLYQDSRKLVNPYGPATTVNCASFAAFSVYEVVTYSGKVTFSSAEFSCSDWRLSVTNASRTPARNALNPTVTVLYTEAELKLQAGLVNSSPEFDSINAPVLFVNKYQDHQLSMSARDLDGDSLVYTLVTPLEGHNTMITYDTIGHSGLGGFMINYNPLPPFNNLPPGNPGSNPQVAIFAGGITNYSATYPMDSYHVTWTPGQQVVFAAPYFYLEAADGALKFNTSVYYDSAAYWENRYLVSVKVEEFRKINNVIVKVGSVRRETLIQVMDGGANQNPQVTARMANNQPIASGTEIQLRPGTPLNLQIAASDGNAADAVSITSNVSAILTGATLTNTTGNASTGTISWTPTAADVRDQPYYFQVQLRDNANPLRGVHTETFAVRVSHTGGVTGTTDALIFNANFTAYPNPFTDKISFKFNQQAKAESIMIFNLLGQQVDQITISKTASGTQEIKWETSGKHAAGLYVAKLISEGKTLQTLKFTKVQ
ncbi:T9SS type A sorting domain-containing protein [Adhaeribacter sp. BT258]|uniref:T9SS type A sorting domain-containing protein n=1 Tax=Adhaeribacter terrigena TaxID=2793070 RepID=A0ABS1C482_9BACT|nr:T9SS type A sorting domain-containing protein [Adhaeribacter terrigena]MBK0403986.1 T9SS type A sorting domain-containing protein [Adhaeribacter terrigena]